MLAELLAERMSKAVDNVPIKICDISETDVSIYIGSAGASRNKGALEAAGIGRIITCHQTLCTPFGDAFEYLTVPVKDKPNEDIAQYFSAAIEFIEASKKSVLVHCMQGKSRSATVIAAYLIQTRKVDLPQAMDIIRNARPGANPNLGFAAQLRAFAKKQTGSVEDRPAATERTSQTEGE